MNVNDPANTAMWNAKKALQEKWVALHEAVGKTISAASNKYEDIYVAFTDGTFTAFGAEADDCDAVISDKKRAAEFDDDALHDLGLIPDAVYVPFRAAVDAENNAWREQRDAAEFARLKAEVRKRRRMSATAYRHRRPLAEPDCTECAMGASTRCRRRACGRLLCATCAGLDRICSRCASAAEAASDSRRGR